MNRIENSISLLSILIMTRLSKKLNLRVSQQEIIKSLRINKFDLALHELENISKTRNLFIYKLFYK